jgi:hypothetical protein
MGKIVSASWKLFYEQGYEDTTVEDIIKEDISLSKLMICLSGQHNLPGDFVGTRTFATRSGFKTPIYNAYALSAMLGETILECETDEKPGVVPTLCENGDVAVAIFNYSKKLLKRNGTLNTRLEIKLPDGEYRLTETGAPAGYKYATAIEFKVEDGKVYQKLDDGSYSTSADPKLTMVDEAKVGSITITGEKF